MTHIILILTAFLLACTKPGNDSGDRYGNEVAGITGDIANAGLLEMELWDPPESAIHIDPENATGLYRDGSREHPFSSFDEVEWKDNTVYALKRGTTIETGTVMLFGDNITLASYGEGERPVIKSTSEAHAVSTKWESGHNITVRDIEIYAPDAVSCLIFRTNSTNAKAINLKLHGAIWGLRALNNIAGLLVHNTEIFNIADDGMFIQESRNIEISHCYIHSVNQNWSPPSTPSTEAAGDGIQFERCNNWHVHHNIIDRSDTGNKFCFISNNPEQDNGIFEYNVLKGPMDRGFSIYIGDGRNIIVRYNYIAGPSQSPFYSHGNDLKIYYNIFRDINGPLYVSGSAEVYNNLFYNNAMGIEGGRITVKNNIFDLGSVNRPRFNVRELTESNNLFVYGIPTRYSETGNPNYVDPENSNFRLLPQSDAIDGGVDVGIRRDFDGNPVPAGMAPDIGPFEYQH